MAKDEESVAVAAVAMAAVAMVSSGTAGSPPKVGRRTVEW